MPGGNDREELATIVHQSRAICDTPDETAEIILATGYVRVSADPDTVERVADAIHAGTCPCGGAYSVDHTDYNDYHAYARAAINAIGGEQ